GGDPALLARLKSRSVNVLALLYARVYFPAYANTLKEIAGCLGFRWSGPDASGLQAIAWRHAWQTTRDETTKQRLLTYNEEDCSALQRVVEMLRSLGNGTQRPADDTGPRVTGLEGVETSPGRKYGNRKFALPEFARITKCAYFDYQRDKVLCRNSSFK